MCALATPALAEDFFLASGRGLNFASRTVVERAVADLAVEGNVVHARAGLRREKGREQLASSTVLTLGDVLLVKDAAGRLQRLRFLAHTRGVVHLVWFDAAAHVGARTAGSYENTRALVNGAPADPLFGALTVRDDGRFSLGQARGSWNSADGRLELTTIAPLWGYPEVTRGGDRLTFRFVRDSLVWEIVFEHALEGAEEVAMAD
jgi:hypothetical protein